MGIRATSYMPPPSIHTPMEKEAGDNRSVFYCNYCGEPVTVGLSMFHHIDRCHAAEVYIGPGEYDPGRKKRSIVIGIVGTAVIAAATLLVAVAFGAEMGGDAVTLLVLLSLGLALLLYVYCGFYETKWRKPGDEILMDLLVDCDICGIRLPFRDLETHTALNHPDEHAIEKRLDDPVQWVAVALLGIGFGGAAVLWLAGSFMVGAPEVLVILIVVSISAFVAAMVLLLLFDKLYRGPRVRRMAKEWDERNPNSRKE